MSGAETAAAYLTMTDASIMRACDTGDNSHIWLAVMQLRTALRLHLTECHAAPVAAPGVVKLDGDHWLDMRTGIVYDGDAEHININYSDGYNVIGGEAAAALRLHLDRLAGVAAPEVTP